MREYLRQLKGLVVDILLPLLRSQFDLGVWRQKWQAMIALPWQDSRPISNDERRIRLLYWLLGWVWTLAGLVLGALVAPSIARWAGVPDGQWLDGVVIGITVLAGIIVQLLSWVLLAPIAFLTLVILALPLAAFLDIVAAVIPARRDKIRQLAENSGGLLAIPMYSVPLAAVGYGIYRYLTWVGSSQRDITIAFVISLFIKTCLPLIQSTAFGMGFKKIMDWLRDDKSKTAQHVVHAGIEDETPNQDA